SARSMALARELDGVIINCDSIQIYAALPILSAQPSAADKEEIPHRLYGTLSPDDPCSAGNWREMAIPVIESVLKEGRTPIICGGTGLYIKALMEGLSPIPDIPQEIRERAASRQQELGNPAFHEALHARDPVMGERLHPYNTARLVRAWEVLEATGKSLADWQDLPLEGPPADWRFEVEVILPERDTLYERCNTRFLQMFEGGALEEVEAFGQALEEGTYRAGTPATKTLGFTHLYDYLQGRKSKEEAITLSQGETRRYAKRQVTWFRNQI
ncbi:MAG: tRNA (adenosine(37)-N6)-dimethylallyltransferase MiaA, partial [Alphaproteobacteria bacterium]